MSTQAKTSILTIFSAVKATQGIMQMMQNGTITGKFETIWLQKRRRIIHLQCHHWTSFSLCLRISIMNIRMNRKVLLRRDWEDVKDGIMEEVIRAKFTQNPELAKKLVATGDVLLMESNNWHDTYWGVDSRTLEGENHLGVILMKIRTELSQGDYLEMAEKAKAEKEEAERQAAETLEKERQEIQAKLDQIPAYDFVGMEVGTKAFGKGKIISQEGEYLTVLVREQEKKFALPGCFVQGFLIPDDKEIVENLRMGQDLKKRLIDLEKNKLKP